MTEITRRGFLGVAVAAAAAGMVGAAHAQSAAAAEAADNEIYAFGWEPDLPQQDVDVLDFDFRDDLPAKVDLTTAFPPVYNQGPIGSCVANAVAGAVQYARLQQNKDEDFVPSRMFLYYYARLATHTEALDTGSRISNAMAVARDRGVCKEATWVYDNVKANSQTHVFPSVAQGGKEPSATAQTEGLDYRLTDFKQVSKTENNVRTVLASGFPVVFGFTVYSNMFGADRRPVRVLNKPVASDTLVGGHAVCIVGYDDARRMFRIRNSWGKSVHDNGYFDMSYEYVLGSLSRDFWTIFDTLNAPPVGG